jgi:hypothetical protein
MPPPEWINDLIWIAGNAIYRSEGSSGDKIQSPDTLFRAKRAGLTAPVDSLVSPERKGNLSWPPISTNSSASRIILASSSTIRARDRVNRCARGGPNPGRARGEGMGANGYFDHPSSCRSYSGHPWTKGGGQGGQEDRRPRRRDRRGDVTLTGEQLASGLLHHHRGHDLSMVRAEGIEPSRGYPQRIFVPSTAFAASPDACALWLVCGLDYPFTVAFVALCRSP